jgi:hypothetical protein
MELIHYERLSLDHKHGILKDNSQGFQMGFHS